MSKAFTRESDDQPDRPEIPLAPSPLPPGVKNYITPEGARRLREELERLLETSRAAASTHPDTTSGGQTSLPLTTRIARLRHSLASAVVTPAPTANETRVKFGAMVTVRDRHGVASVYRIVGVDEADADRGWVSWISPLAKALMNKRAGERVRLFLPDGPEDLEIVSVAYD